MILSKPPQQADGQDALDEPRALTSDAPVGNWTWHGAVPRTWKPTYAENGTTREVVLHIHNPIGGEAIYRATDTYPAGSYDGKTETTVQRQLLLPARIIVVDQALNDDKVWDRPRRAGRACMASLDAQPRTAEAVVRAAVQIGGPLREVPNTEPTVLPVAFNQGVAGS